MVSGYYHDYIYCQIFFSPRNLSKHLFFTQSNLFFVYILIMGRNFFEKLDFVRYYLRFSCILRQTRDAHTIRIH